MDLTLIQQIKLCANKLKDSKLNFKKRGEHLQGIGQFRLPYGA